MVPGTGLLAACVPGMFDTWMMLLRDYGTMRLADVLAPAISYASHGHPLVERANATIATVEQLFRQHWPTSAAVYLPGGNVPAIGTLFTNKTLADTYTRVLREAESAGGDRVKQIEKARLTWARGLRRRGDRSLLPHPGGHGHQRPAPSRRAHRRGHRRLGGACRGAAHLRLRPLHRLQGRPVVAGPGDAAAAGAAQALRSRRRRSGERGVRPHAGRMLQARLCGPREVLRRSRLRRSADGDAAVGRLQRRAPQAHHRQGLARVAAGLGRRLRRGGQAAARGRPAPRRRPYGRRRADRRAGSARCAATPCISTSSIRPATW